MYANSITWTKLQKLTNLLEFQRTNTAIQHQLARLHVGETVIIVIIPMHQTKEPISGTVIVLVNVTDVLVVPLYYQFPVCVNHAP